jgi:hypothetical protein
MNKKKSGEEIMSPLFSRISFKESITISLDFLMFLDMGRGLVTVRTKKKDSHEGCPYDNLYLFRVVVIMYP